MDQQQQQQQQPQQAPPGQQGPMGPAGRRLHIAHRRSPSELTPLMSSCTHTRGANTANIARSGAACYCTAD